MWLAQNVAWFRVSAITAATEKSRRTQLLAWANHAHEHPELAGPLGHVTAFQENDHDYHITAEAKQRIAGCPTFTKMKRC